MTSTAQAKFLIFVFSIICYWLYLNLCLGYFLSNFFVSLVDEINKNNIAKIIQFRKKFGLKNLLKLIIDFVLKLIKNWFIRIRDKFLLLIDAIKRVIKALKIFRKKFKSILKFKSNFQRLKDLLLIIWQNRFVWRSVMSEIMFLKNLINWVIAVINLIRLLMNESLLITRIVYFLYLILLGVLGIIIGFLLGLYKREDEINPLLLLFLLIILYNYGFYDVLLEYLHNLYLESNTGDICSKFSLKSIEQIDPRPSKITFKEPQQIPLPFLIIEDPLVVIDIEILWDESTNYQFELFKFCSSVNQKVKS